MLPGQGDMRGWSQALWLLGQKWRMQEESWMVYFKCLIALFACHYWNFDITTQKLITSTRSIYFPLVGAPLFISFTFHFRMLVSCPVSCNQCKNKCDDNNVYCKVAKPPRYLKTYFLNNSYGSEIQYFVKTTTSGLGKARRVQEEPRLHEHLLFKGLFYKQI